MPSTQSLMILAVAIVALLLVLNFIRSGNSVPVVTAIVSECEHASDRGACYEKDLQRALEGGGISGGLEHLRSLSQTSTKFSGVCHALAHSVGTYAYRQFTTRNDFQISSAMAYCSYGFYHGFMEELLNDTGDYKKATQFCAEFVDKKAPAGSGLRDECFHGIGHGVTDWHIPSDWKDVEKVAKSALSVCKAVGDTEVEFRACAGGVYNAIANVYREGAYNVSQNVADSLRLCQHAELSVQESCYGFMGRVFLKNDVSFSQALTQAVAHTEGASREPVIQGLAIVAASKITTHMTDALTSCQSLNASSQDSCIVGFAVGLVQSGAPWKEYAKAIPFCSHAGLTTEQSTGCFARISKDLRRLHSTANLARACTVYAVSDRRAICLKALADS